MGFLDNSGDIILDAVLTDTGRFRLARGDGSFKIAKFALGDEEINYGNYDKNHASGSAYYDLSVLQTPILEAFTNNTSTMKSKLISISGTNLLYLPVLERNNVAPHFKPMAFPLGKHGTDDTARILTAVACTDETTENAQPSGGGNTMAEGVIGGNPGNQSDAIKASVCHGIRLDQGLDTSEISPSLSIDQDLYESQYLIEIDNRFGSITPPGDGLKTAIAYAFKDDDEIASYYVSDADSNFVTKNTETGTTTNVATEVIAGPRGSTLNFSVRPSLELQQSTYLFDRYGSSEVCDGTLSRMKFNGSPTMKFIDTIVRVTGVTTGYRIDVPIRFIRKV